jgi:hypothetical protein
MYHEATDLLWPDANVHRWTGTFSMRSYVTVPHRVAGLMSTTLYWLAMAISTSVRLSWRDAIPQATQGLVAEVPRDDGSQSAIATQATSMLSASRKSVTGLAAPSPLNGSLRSPWRRSRVR